MRIQKYILLGFILISCDTQTPKPNCPEAGAFVMTLNNESGRIKWDKKSERYYIHLSPDGSLNYNVRAFPCNLRPEFSLEENVIFDGDFFKVKTDSVHQGNDFIVNVRKIKYQ